MVGFEAMKHPVVVSCLCKELSLGDSFLSALPLAIRKRLSYGGVGSALEADNCKRVW